MSFPQVARVFWRIQEPTVWPKFKPREGFVKQPSDEDKKILDEHIRVMLDGTEDEEDDRKQSTAELQIARNNLKEILDKTE